MDMVQAKQLIFEYEKRDEEGNVIGSHARSTRWIST